MKDVSYSCNHLDFNKSYGCVTCDNERKLASLGAIDMGHVDEDMMKWIDGNNVDMWEEESILSAATCTCGDGCDCGCCQ